MTPSSSETPLVAPAAPSSRRVPIWLAFTGGGCVVAALALLALSPSAPAEQGLSHPTVTVDGESVRIPDGAPQWHYVELAVAQEAPAIAPLPAPGRVDFDETRTASVGAPLAGRVEQMRVRLGDRVKAGDRLFSVRSAAFADLDRELHGAEAELTEKQRTAERLKELVALNAAPEKDLLAAQTEQRQAELALEAARAKQASLKVASEGSNLYWVTAPRPGTVVDLDVVASQEVTPEHDKPLLRISDLDEVLVIADMQEADAADLREGQSVSVHTQNGGAVRTGKVERISEVVDPQRRTVEVRVRVANADRVLHPNAFAEVTPEPPAGIKRVRVPAAAVVTDGARSVVFVAREPSRLERVAVVPGRQRDGQVELHGGLNAGEHFVAHGALLLENQIELAN
ncbi:MAG: efflux RND transporter periplasmic adaptor subunit [Hyalangium sp.]